MKDRLSQELETLRIDRESKPSPGPRLSRRVLVPLAVGAVGLLALAVWFGARPPMVQVARVTGMEMSQPVAVLVAGGYVVPHHKIQLGTKVMGRVTWIGVEKGDRVQKNQMVVRLEDREYRAQVGEASGTLQAAEARLRQMEAGSRPQEIEHARARLEEAQANLRNAKLNLERSEGLSREGVVSREALDNARAQSDMVEAQVEAAEKQYELVRLGPRQEEIDQARAQVQQARGTLQFAEAQLEATRIRSPVSGTVLERLVEQGEMVTTMFVGERGAKSSVVTLADLNDLQVELDISQSEFARVSLGQPCRVVPDAFPDRRYRGVVAEIAPEADRQKATVQVKVQVENPDEYLRPEMNAKVFFEDPEGGQVRERELMVPRAAVFQAEGQPAVLAVENSRTARKTVRLGPQTGGSVRILSGLTGDEVVVVSNPEALKNGQRVRTPSRQ